HVDPGGDAGRGPHTAVAHEDGFAVDLDLRVGPTEPIARRPVGGGAFAVEYAGARDDEGAVVDRADAADDARRPHQPADERRAGRLRVERAIGAADDV